jgi:hypothetical protein
MRTFRIKIYVWATYLVSLMAFGCADEETVRGGGYPGVPVASISVDEMIVPVGTLVQLDGSKSLAQAKGSSSFDDEELLIAFHWAFAEMPAGSSAEINNRHLQKPWFSPDMAGEYVIAMYVDNGVWKSETKTITIKVQDCFPTVDPVTSYPDEPVARNLIQVSAQVTEECGEQKPFRYQWQFASLPAGSSATLNNAQIEAPSFFADVAGDYVLNLSVSDAWGRHGQPVTHTISVTSSTLTCGTAAPVAKIEAIWSSGTPADFPNFKVPVDSNIQLSGQASSDADNDAPCSLGQELFYSWRFISAAPDSDAKFNNSQIINPTFSVGMPGAYQIGLTVMDSIGLISKETTVIVTAQYQNP